MSNPTTSAPETGAATETVALTAKCAITGPMHTQRLVLRAFAPDDGPALLAYRSKPEVCRYLYDEPATEELIRPILTRGLARTVLRVPGDVLAWVIELPAGAPDGGNAVIGDVILHWNSDVHRFAEIGWILHPAFQGHGYATEAVRHLLHVGFAEFRHEGAGLHRIVARADARNLASVALMRRLGMRAEALFVENEFIKGEWTDEIVYAILDREWAAANGQP